MSEINRDDVPQDGQLPLSQHGLPDSLLNGDKARRGSRVRQNVIKSAAAVAVVATGATLAAVRPWQNNGATPDQARVAIAGHHFIHPRILSVVDDLNTVHGQDTVEITVSVPTDPTAARDMKQYATNNAVEWLVPSGVTSYLINRNMKTEKYEITGLGFGAQIPEAVPGGVALHIAGDNTATVIEHPNDKDPIGTKIALFASTEAMTSSNKNLTRTDGEQFLGAVEKTQDGWGLMSEQPQLPDRVVTSTSQWQSPTSMGSS